ncbi:MAG: S-adenosylmethionine:tRNA ribosyltransferase-isomerase [Bacteroidales bacterium]
MKKPKDIPVKLFHYDLPDHRIAKYPLDKRDHSKLLVHKEGETKTKHFYELTEVLNSNTQLVFNNSKVIHARLIFRKESGARIEVFWIEPLNPSDYQLNFSSRDRVTWKCIVGNSKKWKTGKLKLKNPEGTIKLEAERINKLKGEEHIRFSWEPVQMSFSEIIQLFGHTPIPPYLQREDVASDSENYQTVYSKLEGSVAAPTAGLHFTHSLLEKLKTEKFDMTEVTLHVGAGTFTPVKAENGIDHDMHMERFHIHREQLKNLIKGSDPITPVGTTSCRTLESIYWMGVKILSDHPHIECHHLDQFEAYRLNDKVSRRQALNAVLEYLETNDKDIFFGSTRIMISPGYDFKMTDCLITNFHQPGSTLLMLISALVGDKWREIYDYALENDYRFLSYGDSSILFR